MLGILRLSVQIFSLFEKDALNTGRRRGEEKTSVRRTLFGSRGLEETFRFTPSWDPIFLSFSVSDLLSPPPPRFALSGPLSPRPSSPVFLRRDPSRKYLFFFFLRLKFLVQLLVLQLG